MSKQYATIAFTPRVRAEQHAHGSGDFYGRKAALGEGVEGGDALTADVREFLAGRDTFYLASVGETGWPYVNLRGGARGFLQVVDDHTVGWADFRGNLQHVSTGNVAGDDRVALLVIDYPSRTRLKIFGRARVAEAADEPELTARLTLPDHDGVVERAVLVSVEAYDWNCPQHITPRYSMDELADQLAPWQEELTRLRADNERLRAALGETA
jgi:predicted pyridoxine 5'-phosphate oxidase superfamily flavin-nucleotide-binding protein